MDRHERLVIVGRVWTFEGLRNQRLLEVMALGEN
jgi:hypothetical protein